MAAGIASRLRWYANRLRCMSIAEVLHRCRDAATGQLLRVGLVPARRPPPARIVTSAPAWLRVPDVDPAPYVAAADAVAAGRVTVFGGAVLELGRPPRWNHDPSTGTEAPLKPGRLLPIKNVGVCGDIRYLWEPNRHLALVRLAQAYALTGEPRFADALCEQVESWLTQCPYPRGPNWSSALEVAIRLINWAVTWQLIGGADSAVFDGPQRTALRTRWIESVYQHAHFIRHNFSAHSSANNHLIGEAAGLFIAGITWPYWRQASVWCEDGRRLLEAELRRQVFADGVDREQTTGYQQFVLSFLLLAGLAGRSADIGFTDAFWSRIERMMDFLSAVMDIGGNMPAIGDSDDALVVDLAPGQRTCPYRALLFVGAALFRRADFAHRSREFAETARWLLPGDKVSETLQTAAAPDDPGAQRLNFIDGGYYILGDRLGEPDEIRAIFDAGPLGYLAIASHGHADALSLLLSVSGQPVLVDAGTYVYDADTRWRAYFRGTAAHNTVLIDGLDQSVSGGSFMWLDKAVAHVTRYEQTATTERVAAWHDGYTRLKDPVVHGREVAIDRPERRLRVVDDIRCRSTHSVAVGWHFHDRLAVSRLDASTLAVNGDGIHLQLRVTGACGRFELLHGSESPQGGWISPRFCVRAPTTTARWLADIRGNAKFTTTIEIDA